MTEEKKFDEKDLSSMIKIQLGIDIPEERLKEWDISKEEMCKALVGAQELKPSRELIKDKIKSAKKQIEDLNDKISGLESLLKIIPEGFGGEGNKVLADMVNRYW